jgi:hypothetical protein
MRFVQASVGELIPDGGVAGGLLVTGIGADACFAMAFELCTELAFDDIA